MSPTASTIGVCTGLSCPHRGHARPHAGVRDHRPPAASCQLSRSSAPTLPRVRGLRLPRCPGALHRPATDSGASPPRCPGALHRLRHGLGGFASLVVWALYADFATYSGASPTSSFGCTSPTLPRTWGLRLTHRPGALCRLHHRLRGLAPLIAWVLLADTG